MENPNTQFTSQQNNILPENFYSQRFYKKTITTKVSQSDLRFQRTMPKNKRVIRRNFYFQQRSASLLTLKKEI